MRAKLDVALIIFQTDKEKGKRLLQEYYHAINDNRPHKAYVRKLAGTLGVNLKT